ncbi:hypothetical protein [Cognatiluteimonas telluris]|jgi:hypothetical protein|uniref:hypothetical protein n=1 Tax=Cognatiluteimonas telluris TaxID=1104775 RepID=UPI00140E1F6B|nr:hypothetical protein [Lysobacter telluris]
MSKTPVFQLCVLLAGIALAGAAGAQVASACPDLPGNAGLTWEYRGSGDTQLCRALRPDGSEVFGMAITAKPTFEPSRSDRAERSQVGGRDVYWYRTEIAAKPGVEAREALLELPDGRSAHVWLQADSEEKLEADYQLLQSVNFGAPAQVAGQ